MASSTSLISPQKRDDDDSPLSKLLQLTQSLHETTADLTLLQLVPIHQSLLQAIVMLQPGQTRDTSSNLTSSTSSSTSSRFIPWCTKPSKEALVVESILSDPAQPLAKYLLVAQYLFSQASAASTSSSKAVDLWWTIGNFLEQCNPLFQDSSTTGCDETSSVGITDHDRQVFLRALVKIALMDVSTASDSSTVTTKEIMQWIRPSHESPTQAMSKFYWERTTFLLVAWQAEPAFELSSSSYQQVCDILVDFLDQLLRSIWESTSIDKKPNIDVWEELSQSTGWKALTQILLPALVDMLGQHNKDQNNNYLTSILWKIVWGFWKENELAAKEKSGVVLIVTTILCPVFPFLAKQETLPNPPTFSDEKGSPLVEQPEVWRFLKDCLRQGLDDLTNQGAKDSNGRLATRAVSTLIRRRGLYLLRTMTADMENLQDWNRYVACFETLEMEEDKHLVSQVWSTVASLMMKTSFQEKKEPTSNLPTLSLDWLLLLLGHALTAPDLPFLRKENLYRFFRGGTGLFVPKLQTPDTPGVPLSTIPFDFIWHIVIPAFDSLEQSVGLYVHWIINGKTIQNDVGAAFEHFLLYYMEEMMSTNDQKWLGPWLTSGIMMQLRAKTVTSLLKTVSCILRDIKRTLQVDSSAFSTIANNFSSMFAGGRYVPTYRSSIYESMSSILALTKTSGRIDPQGVLSLLNFFPFPKLNRVFSDTGGESSITKDPVFGNLRVWIQGIAAQDASWFSSIPSTLASAFVDGILTESGEAAKWTPGTRRKQEHLISQSIAILCTMTAEESSSTAGQMLWPAINKGLSFTPSILLSPSGPSLQRVSRASVLLEQGCKLQVLSGNGNGDLVVDRKTNQMMPPPPSIEGLLSHAASFLIHMIKQVLTPTGETYGSRSVESRALTAKLAGYIETLRTLQQGYPSSHTISEATADSLKLGLKSILDRDRISVDLVPHVALVYAAVDSGADTSKLSTKNICTSLLNVELDNGTQNISDISYNAIQCIFEYSRWGTLLKLLPGILEMNDPKTCERVIEKAAQLVESCPTEATMALFECAVMTARYMITSNSTGSVLYLKDLINALTKIMAKRIRGKEYVSMLDELSKLLFQRRLLLDEYQTLQKNSQAETPVRSAFRKLVKTAGTKRPHIIRALLSRLIPTWLTRNKDISAGELAIPYREDIVELLLYREDRLTLSEVSVRDLDAAPESHRARPPQSAHEMSLVRSFILAFLSELETNDEVVRDNLLNYVILQLLEKVLLGGNELFMFGSPQHCKIHRGWQALCILSRFVGKDIAAKVCDGVFLAMQDQMHGQTRFFLEIFTIQCARMHPQIFGQGLCAHIVRYDLTSQMVASLMIVSGHLVVGKYKSEFMPHKRKAWGDATTTSPISLPDLLAGTIPWLGSTQGFTRAIAQLIVHALIPIAIDVTNTSTELADGTDDWYLRNIYSFLEENREMKRLRKKQLKFFETLDVDQYTTLDGCLSIAVDEVGEAIPTHMIEIIKQTLKDTYQDTHGETAPTWKQVQDMMVGQDDMNKAAVDALDDNSNSGTAVNFQRKIIPLDALNLALENHREKRLRNVAGRRRQPLIVCASLVDKVPNLGGLARTSEIFAADRLVIPDKSVMKTDNFTSISVSASDWIEIEECSEKNLLQWLRARKVEGWYVVGLEQTSSSVSMVDFSFPEHDRPTILLLGKEREGIPVEFLQAVDQCVEIPQLGIIRSLNVHVTGALAIWEYTRQRMMLTAKRTASATSRKD